MKKLNKQQQKLLQKPWFTTGIQNSIQKKNALYSCKMSKSCYKKMIYIENIKVTEISYPQSQKKVKESIMMIISELTC